MYQRIHLQAAPHKAPKSLRPAVDVPAIYEVMSTWLPLLVAPWMAVPGAMEEYTVIQQ
jgi:hypothetical protein